MTNMKGSGILLGIALLLHLPPAYAYLDPGTGSMILQGIVGAVAATAAAVGLYWTRVKAFFTGRGKSSSATEPDNGGTDSNGESPTANNPQP
jgi:hypothetical protein